MAFKSNFFILTVLVVFACATLSEGRLTGLTGFTRTCATTANEVYRWCGSRCPVTCANRAAPPSCDGCTKGCFCTSGFLRNAAGACVLPANC